MLVDFKADYLPLHEDSIPRFCLYFVLFQLILTLVMQSFEEIFFLIEMMGFGFAIVLSCVFAGQIYLRVREPEIPRPIKVGKSTR
jgi:amino acid transporter